MYVMRYYYVSEGGDLELAKDLLETVVASNSDDADSAADLLKKVTGVIGRTSVNLQETFLTCTSLYEPKKWKKFMKGA
jgi:hypothetical protein